MIRLDLPELRMLRVLWCRNERVREKNERFELETRTDFRSFKMCVVVCACLWSFDKLDSAFWIIWVRIVRGDGEDKLDEREGDKGYEGNEGDEAWKRIMTWWLFSSDV